VRRKPQRLRNGRHSPLLRSTKSGRAALQALVLWGGVAVIIVIGLLVIFVPVGCLIGVSLTSLRGFSSNYSYLGLWNYVEAFRQPEFWRGARNTITYAIGSCIGQTVLGTVMALVLGGWQARTRRAIAIVFFVPYLVVPAVIAVQLWRFLIDPRVGAITLAIHRVTGHETYFMSEGLVMISLIGISTWMFAPFVMLVVSRSIEEIPSRRFEVIALDGGRSADTFRHVVFPAIGPAILGVALLRLVLMATKFDVPYLFLGSGPLSSKFGPTTVLIYELAYERLRYGEASAVGVMMLLTLFLVIWSVVLWQAVRGGT